MKARARVPGDGAEPGGWGSAGPLRVPASGAQLWGSCCHSPPSHHGEGARAAGFHTGKWAASRAARSTKLQLCSQTIFLKVNPFLFLTPCLQWNISCFIHVDNWKALDLIKRISTSTFTEPFHFCCIAQIAFWNMVRVEIGPLNLNCQKYKNLL